MDTRHEQLVALAHEHGPCSVRHLFYRAVVSGVPGITKSESGYTKVQRALLDLRRQGLIAYNLVVDNTRWQRKPVTWGSLSEALEHTAHTYRRDLWRLSPYRVEVWCESDSIAGTVVDVTTSWDVPLMVSRGYSSETFAYEAADEWRQDVHRHPVVLYIGDHDPAGLEIEAALRDTLERFYGGNFSWSRVGVTWPQVGMFDLPGTTPKKDYGFELAVEAEALEPGYLRDLLETQIGGYVDGEQLAVLEAAEASERELLISIANRDFTGVGA